MGIEVHDHQKPNSPNKFYEKFMTAMGRIIMQVDIGASRHTGVNDSH